MRDQCPDILIGSEVLEEPSERQRGNFSVVFEQHACKSPLRADQKVHEHVNGVVEPLLELVSWERIIEHDDRVDLALKAPDLGMLEIETAVLLENPQFLGKHRFH